MGWEIVCGSLPFEIPPVILAQAGLKFDLPPLPDAVPTPLADLLRACLSVEPKARPDARAVARALMAMGGGAGMPFAAAPAKRYERTIS